MAERTDGLPNQTPSYDTEPSLRTTWRYYTFYQLLIELLGPVFWVLYMAISVSEKFDPLNYLISAGYVLTQIAMTLFAVSFDYRHKAREFLKLIPRLVFTSIEGIIFHIVIMGARLYGMITFHWRRMVL